MKLRLPAELPLGACLLLAGAASACAAGDASHPDARSDVAPATDATTGLDAPRDGVAPADDGQPDDAPTPPDDAAGDVVVDTGPPPVPVPTPIRYLVIMTKENHTFDNMFYGFPGVSSPAPTSARRGNGTTINLTRAVLPFTVLHRIGSNTVTADPVHTHYQARNSYHNGAMDQFDQPDHPDVGDLPFYHYPESDIRNYWAYARHFVLADNYFSTTLGPSLPGHLAVLLGYSPVLDNVSCPAGATCPADPCDPTTRATVPRLNDLTCTETPNAGTCFSVPCVVDQLAPGLTWRTYGGSPIAHVKSIHDSHALMTHQRPAAQLISDLQRGDMANLTLLNGGFGGPSEHPPDHPCRGENYTVQIINAIIAGGHWNETAIVLGYDDWGGWYDHVAPHVTACASAADGPYNPGFRLPLLIISPYSRTGTTGSGLVYHTRTEQASVTRLVAELFHAPGHDPVFLQARNPQARDQSAGSLLGAFDFTQPPRPPLMLTPRTDCPPPPPP